jgi:hypothetical protein
MPYTDVRHSRTAIRIRATPVAQLRARHDASQKLRVKSRSAAAELILDRESGLGPGILRISPEESPPEIG